MCIGKRALRHMRNARKERDESWWAAYAAREAKYFTPRYTITPPRDAAPPSQPSKAPSEAPLLDFDSSFLGGYKRYASTHDQRSPFVEGYKQFVRKEEDYSRRYRGPRNNWGEPLVKRWVRPRGW